MCLLEPDQLSDEARLMLEGKICPYCKNESVFVDSSVIYGRSYGMIYLCKPCDAYCGVHKGTTDALGRLANKELREYKKQAHFHFDQLWKDKYIDRHGAYKWLSEELHIHPSLTHIGMFSVSTCKKVIELSIIKLNEVTNHV